MTIQKHEIVLKKLLRDIFNNKIKAGEKIPTERQLSLEFGVDRTSLRVALKQLESMQLLDIRQGNGIYVKNYRKHAGVDFLRMLLFQGSEDIDEIILDSFLVEEMWSFWAEFMPLVIRMAMSRITPMEIKEFLDVIDEQLDHLDDRDQIVDLEVKSQDMVAEKTGNLIILLVSNSTRQIRKKISTMIYDMADIEFLKQHLELKRTLLRGYLTGEINDPEIFSKEHKRIMGHHKDVIRKVWAYSDREKELVRQALRTA